MNSMHIWQGIPRHTREYIRQELADNGIDIEQVLATAETPSNHICAPEEKFLSIQNFFRSGKPRDWPSAAGQQSYVASKTRASLP